MRRRTVVVKSRRIAWMLRKEVYRIIKIAPDRFRPQFNIFIFQNEPGLGKSLKKYIEETEEYRRVRDQKK